MSFEDASKTANWDSLFDTYKVKIATLIYNIYNRTALSCLEHIMQRKEHKYDLCHQHRVSAQRFETYHMKNSISRRGSIVWNILEPSAVSARDYAKRTKKSHALRNLNFNEELPQMGRPRIDMDFSFCEHIHIFYCTYSTFYWLHSVFIILIFLFLFLLFDYIFYTAP